MLWMILIGAWIGLGILVDLALWRVQRGFLQQQAAAGEAATAEGRWRADRLLAMRLTAVLRLALATAWVAFGLAVTADKPPALHNAWVALGVGIDGLCCVLLWRLFEYKTWRESLRLAGRRVLWLWALGAVFYVLVYAVAPGELFGLAAALVWLLALGLGSAWQALRADHTAALSRLDDAALRHRLAGLAARAGVARVGLYVVADGPSAETVAARAERTPRGSHVLLTRGLLAYLEPEAVAATVAHELGHIRAHHVAIYHTLRSLLALGYAALAGMGLAFAWPELSSLAGVWLLYLAAVPLGWAVWPWFAAYRRRCEFAADAYAAAQTSTVSIRAALVALFAVNPHRAGLHPGYRLYYATHPADAARLAALDDRPSSINRE